mgnify:CR=1 FL=1
MDNVFTFTNTTNDHKLRSGGEPMLTLLTYIGVALLIGGAVLSVKIMQNQQHREFDKRLPGQVVRHPVARNSIVIWYIATPIAAVVLGLIAWMIFGS